MGIELSAFWVLSWILTLKFLQLALWPGLKQYFGTAGYPISFSASVLVYTLITWYCGLVVLPVLLALVPFLLMLGWNLWRGEYRSEELREQLRWDALFLTGFFCILMIRVVNPSIQHAEKFMDHAFLASIMRNPLVPPLDPWLSGSTLTVYYYLGYWMFGTLGLTAGIPSTVVFNLALPTVMGLTLVNGYLLGTLLLRRLAWLPLLTFFLVNPSFLWNLIQGTPLSSLLWDSTRTISNTINEYPLFSVLWGDVHPHIMGMFNQVFLLALLVYASQHWPDLSRRSRVATGGLIALSLGTMPLMNSWDVFVYAPLVIVFGVLLWARADRRISSLTFLVTVPFTAVLLYLPYYTMMEATGIRGIARVPVPSDPFQFLLVHGFFLALLFLILRRDIRKRPYLLVVTVPFLVTGLYGVALAVIPLIYLLARRHPGAAEIMAIAGLVVICIPELLYLQDSFGEPYYRMNTVFKWYFTAWILLGTGSLSLLAGELKEVRFPTLPRYAAPVLAVLLILSPLAMGVDEQNGGGGLDGMAFMTYSHPGDAAAIAFLRGLTGPITLVEGENGDYSYYSRVSTFTGIPAVIGWPYHEITWRGNEGGMISQRMADVRAIYERPDRALALMDQYGVTHLYLGDAERERYTVHLPAEGLTSIYDAGGVVIYARTR